jgi:hypothetical protein
VYKLTIYSDHKGIRSRLRYTLEISEARYILITSLHCKTWHNIAMISWMFVMRRHLAHYNYVSHYILPDLLVFLICATFGEVSSTFIVR